MWTTITRTRILTVALALVTAACTSGLNKPTTAQPATLHLMKYRITTCCWWVLLPNRLRIPIATEGVLSPFTVLQQRSIARCVNQRWMGLE